MASNTHYPETKYKSRLSRPAGAADTTLYVDALPSESTGILMINKDSDDNFEIILYGATGGTGTDADPYVLTSVTRGLASNGTSLAAGTGIAHGKVEIGCVDNHYFVALLKAHVDGVQTLPAVANTAALPTSSNTQFDIRFVQAEAAWYYWTLVATSGLTTDWAVLAVSSTPNGSETVAGKWEGATAAEQGSQATTGGSGGPLVVQAQYTVKTHDVYTPAFLTGGTGATSVVATWNAVTDGEFAITIDGVAHDVTGLDFSGDGSMAAIATTIETGVRALTSSTETVVWSTNHFIISSVDATASSAITVTSAVGGGSGTDISGVGGTAFMDAETGRGTVTAAVLDKTAKENYVPLLGSAGEFPDNMIPQNYVRLDDVTAKGDIFAATASGVVTNLAAGADGQGLEYDAAEASGLKVAWRPKRLSTVTTDVTVSASTTETDIISFTVPANAFATANGIRIQAHVSDLDLSANQSITFNVKYDTGGTPTTLGSIIFTAVGGASNNYVGDIEAVILEAGTTSSQDGWLRAHITENSGDTETSKLHAYRSTTLSGSESTTSAKTLVLTGQLGSSGGGNAFTISSAVAELIAG